jgi:hypothetical protein
MAVHIPALPESYLRRVRDTGLDDPGQPAQRLVASGGEPRRDVLPRARYSEPATALSGAAA